MAVKNRLDDRLMSVRQEQQIRRYAALAPLDRLEDAVIRKRLRQGMSRGEAQALIHELWWKYAAWVEGTDE